MNHETERRIAALEQEVHTLKQEVQELKKLHNNKGIELHPTKNLLHSQSFEEKIPDEPTKSFVTIDSLENSEFPFKEEEPKSQYSFEEKMMWALPKVFMIILVLGVLWGLKLISEYGYLSNGVKIILSYILSIGLGITSFILERKGQSPKAVTISLYGGTFIIGILTTAAGAIIYEVLGLYVALFIALIYIVYGIIMSYFKKNEVLTNFVAFTSLLLPYLLEYMDFNGLITLIYVVVLFVAIQLVILKHTQKIALYISFFFSILAIEIIWEISNQSAVPFAIGIFILLIPYMYSWWRFYNIDSKWKTVHEGLLFSTILLSILFINTIIDGLNYGEGILSILAVYFGVTSIYAYKKSSTRLVDVLGTITLLIGLNILLIMEFSTTIFNILMPFSAFLGLFIALRLRASLMKVTYTIVFTTTMIIAYAVNGVLPFWSIEHLNLILPIIYMIMLYSYALRPKEQLTIFEKAMKEMNILEIIPIIISIFFFIYIVKLDWAYLSINGGTPYLLLIMIALSMVASLFVPTRFIGRFLPITLFFGYAVVAISMISISHTTNDVAWLNIIARLLYIAILIAIVGDIFKEGFLFKKWNSYVAKITDSFMSVGVILTMLLMIFILSQLEFYYHFDGKLIVAGHTILLFLTASMALWLSSIRLLKTMRTTGFSILAIAIIKLVFFDLSTLDLLIRAILFITIGAIGMLLSNRILKKNKNN